MALLDNSTHTNTVMLEFVETHSLDVGLITYLVGG